VEIKFKIIGHVSHEFSDDQVRNSFKGVKAKIEIDPKYEDGLEGIDGFSHLILVSYLNKPHRELLKVKPKRLLLFGLDENDLPEIGVFATDSPSRPNPIGISVVKLIERKGRELIVDNCDLFNETPILDIKPLTQDKVPEKISFPEWHTKLLELVKKKSGINLQTV
jgi:conserved hypothetical protein TIGR00104